MMHASHPLQEALQAVKTPSPCILVIFGATGDLTARKLMPALYHLAKEGQLPANFACIAFARRKKSDEEFRKEVFDKLNQFSRSKPIDKELWNTFQQHIFYHQSSFDEDQGYLDLKKRMEIIDKDLGTQGNRVYYLSTQPKSFPTITQKLGENQLSYPYQEEEEAPWSRIIIEKPFGHDYQSALDLQHHICKYFDEQQIYRIDHYLGKETVQNLLVFRFANSIFESIWNNRYIDHVQITVGEEIGIGSRGQFFEENGMLRDIIQNHMMQLLSLVAMEPPVSLLADSIRDEKVKVLDSIRPILPDQFHHYVIRGQYSPGFVNGDSVMGYRQEEHVHETSNIETFVALELFIDNWRWAGVPFYLRAGKRLPKRATEIAISFKTVPGILFQKEKKVQENNVLVIRIQPDEGISLKINCKVPGLSGTIQPVKMNFNYGSYFGTTPPEAYERLICDCILGDNTLFARADEVLSSWKLCTPILERWQEEKPQDFPNYQAGTWGPLLAEDMLKRENHLWRVI